MNHRPSQLSGVIKNGFFVTASPSFRLAEKWRLHTALRYKKLSSSEFFQDNGNLDLNPEVEYSLFSFLSLGAGAYVSYDFNSFNIAGFKPIYDYGPSVSVKIKLKDAFITLRHIKSIDHQVRILLSPLRGQETSYRIGFFQIGIGYTIGKRNTESKDSNNLFAF